MANLGTFGAAVRELDPDAERDTFDFFGETFTVEGVLPGMLALQLGAMFAGKLSGIDSSAALYEALRWVLTVPARNGEDADDTPFLRFHRLAVRNRCDDDELLRLMLNIVGYHVGKATEPLPTSPPGEPSTSTSSNSPSSDSPDWSEPKDLPSAG